MKKSKILIAAFAVMATASVARAEEINLDFDGKKSAPMFAQLLAQAQELPAAEPAGIPARVFTAPELASMDKTVESAIRSARSRGYIELAAGFDCLLRSGTAEQKSAFRHWNTSVPYRLPETCSFKTARPSEKGLLSWICTTVTEIIISTVCETDANGVQTCMDQPVTAIREACKWE